MKTDIAKKTVTFRVDAEELEYLNKVTWHQGRGKPGQLALYLIRRLAAAIEEHGQRLIWPPGFGAHSGRKITTIGAAPGPRELCSTVNPCEGCRDLNGGHRQGGRCPSQAFLCLDASGFIIGGDAAPRSLGTCMFDDWPQGREIMEARFKAAAADGGPVACTGPNDGLVIWPQPTFSTETRQLIGFRCILAPATE